MLENFKEVYDQELKKAQYEVGLEEMILSSPVVRAFVYEVCKCLHGETKKDEGLEEFAKKMPFALTWGKELAHEFSEWVYNEIHGNREEREKWIEEFPAWLNQSTEIWISEIKDWLRCWPGR